MSATTSFFIWFYYGLGGLGGWFIFLLLALIAVIWMLYDSASRRIPAVGWRVAIIVSALLLVPAILFRFTAASPLAAATSPLTPFSEPIFYLGILGGILPVALAVGYYVTYQGMVGCPGGHVYDAILGKCPYDHTAPQGGDHEGVVERGEEPHTDEGGNGRRMPPSKPKAAAWLVTPDGRNLQLNRGLTTIGRSPRNDVELVEATLSREHAKIIEDQGVFRLHDLGGPNHTYVNGQLVREPVVLESDDEVQFGDRMVVHFVTKHR